MVQSVRPSRRKEDREKRRRRILDEAVAMIEEGGLEGLSLHRLSKRLGYTVGALYRYFANKDALIAELQCESIDALGDELSLHWRRIDAFSQERGLGADDTALLGLVSVCLFYQDYAVSSSGSFRLNGMLMSDPRPVIGDQEAVRVMGSVARVLEGVAERLLAAGLVPEEADGESLSLAFSRALLLWSTIHGAMQLKKLMRVAPASWSHEKMALDVLGGLLIGWGVDTEAWSRCLAWLEPLAAS